MPTTHRRSAQHRRARALATTATAVLALAATAGPAAATDPVPLLDAVCQANSAVTFTPGLKLAPQPVHELATATLAACVSSQVVRGSARRPSGTLGCASGSINGVMTVDWVTTAGGTARSFVTIGSGTQSSGSVGVAVSGTVTEGLFTGDQLSATFAANPLDLLRCMLPQGMTSTSGTAVVTLTRPLL